jgi:hypothetical protein
MHTGFRKRNNLASGLFCSERKYILYLSAMQVYCSFFAMSTTAILLQTSETNVVLIVFDIILCEVCACTATVSDRHSTISRCQKNYSLVSDRI